MRARGKGLILAVIASLVFTWTNICAFSQADTPGVGEWTRDINTVRDKAISVYYTNRYVQTSTNKEAFNAACDNLISRLPELDQAGRFNELSRILALLKDGHAAVYRENYLFYPLSLYWLDDGLYLTGTIDAYKNALNMKLSSVGGKTVDELMGILDPFISYDSPSWKKHSFWHYLTDACLLRHVGVAADTDACRFKFEDDSGKAVEFDVRSIYREDAIEWIADPEFSRMMAENPPLCFLRRGNYFFSLPDDGETMYVYYGKCIEDPKYPFQQFMTEIRESWSKSSCKRLILDMRFNSGGGTPLLNPFTDWVKANEDLRLPGSFYVLIGKKTFSAAVQNVALMRQETIATFVGEPTGQKPNHWGQVTETILENTKLALYMSSRYMRVMPYEDPDAIYPDTEIAWNHKDFFKGVDTVLNAVSSGKVPPTRRNVYVRLPRIEAWINDIRQIEVNLTLKYNGLASRIDKKDLHGRFESLISGIKSMDDLDIYLELNRIFRIFEDPYIYFNTSMFQSFDYILQVRDLGDGLYLTFGNKSNQEILGKRIVGVGTCSMDEAREKIARCFYFADFENFMSGNNFFNWNADILHRLGILADPDRLVLKVENKDGKVEDVEVRKFPQSEAKDGFVSASGGCKKKFFSKSYSHGMWHEYLPKQKAFYMNVEFSALPCDDRYDRSAYAEKIIDIIKGNDVEMIVLDFRKTSAMFTGFNPCNDPFYDRLAGFIKDSGNIKVFLLVDKGSPSNSVYEAAYMKQASNAVVVGETPVIGPTNLYSCYYDTTMNKSMTFGIPVRKVSVGGYRDGDLLVPDKMIVRVSKDYFECNDPVLNWIFSLE